MNLDPPYNHTGRGGKGTVGLGTPMGKALKGHWGGHPGSRDEYIHDALKYTAITWNGHLNLNLEFCLARKKSPRLHALVRWYPFKATQCVGSKCFALHMILDSMVYSMGYPISYPMCYSIFCLFNCLFYALSDGLLVVLFDGQSIQWLIKWSIWWDIL